MDKLIYKEASGDLTCRSRDFEKVFATLYAYESTDRTPEQIEVMKVQVLNLSNVVIELQNIIEDLTKEKDRLTELWDVLPVDIQSKAIQVRDHMKKMEA